MEPLSTRGKALRDAFDATARACFHPLALQDVQECFPAVRDPEYIEELHNIINKVLERYDTFAKEEFMDVCRSLGVMEGLQRLDQLCAQQGIHGTDSNVAPCPFSAHFAALTRRVRGGRVKLRVPPAGGLAPEAAARKQRMALKLAERQRLVDLVGQAEQEHAEVSHNTTELRAKVAERASQLEKAAAALGHVHKANAIWANPSAAQVSAQ